MKFSKLMKSDNKKKEMKLKRNAALLSGIYSAQSPSVVNNYFTPCKTPTFLDDLDDTIVPATPSYEQRYNINTIAAKKTPTFRTSPLSKLFEFKSSSTKDSVQNALAKQKLIECLLETPGGSKVQITPRFAKSVDHKKSKRLQKTPMARNYELRSNARSFDQVDNVQVTPKMNLFSAQKTTSAVQKCLLTDLSAKQSPSLTITPTESSSKPESMVTRLKKFCSKSALKVINNSGNSRKSLGSNCSSSSLSSESSEDSFSNRSMEQKRINLNLEKLLDEDCKRHQTAKITSWSYQSVQLTPKSNGVSKVQRPSMGVTSVMLKNMRRTNPRVNSTNFMMDADLLVVPHVFDTAKMNMGVVKKAVEKVEEAAVYDHLERVNYNQIKSRCVQARKVTGSQKFQKNKSVAAFVNNNNNANQISPRVTRISVYTKKALSAVNLNESQQYDSIIF